MTRPGSRVIHVFLNNSRHRRAKAPKLLEKPERRVRPRFLPPYAPHPSRDCGAYAPPGGAQPAPRGLPPVHRGDFPLFLRDPSPGTG